MSQTTEEVRVKCEHETWRSGNYESDQREEVRVKCEHETWRSGNYESDQRGSEGEV